MDFSAEEDGHEQDQAHVPSSSNSVPSLGHFCVRAIGANFNSIDSLGTMPYRIVKPILEDKRCTPDILRKFELNSPHLKKYDQEIWQKFLFDKYPEKMGNYTKGDLAVNSWRKLYTQSQLEDEEKLKQAAVRLRESKQMASTEKKGRQVQMTTKLPPPKRARYGESSWSGASAKPKTLMEKARTQSKKTTTMYRSPGSTIIRKVGVNSSNSSATSTSSSSSSSQSPITGSSSMFISKTAKAVPVPPSALRVSPSKAHNILLRDYLGSDTHMPTSLSSGSGNPVNAPSLTSSNKQFGLQRRAAATSSYPAQPLLANVASSKIPSSSSSVLRHPFTS
ncbi:hypothetical protein FRB94_011787 [Tulasnella sp. JGI-2019a]|nr:hypothetical protein FRB94_011787 [Tulasnella sp. JGI-2019a]